MRPSLEYLNGIATLAVSLTPADEAEALVIATSSALTRFANNHIHQNVAETDVIISIRAVIGQRTGVSMTNRLDSDSLGRCAMSAAEAARHAPEDAHFPGLPEPQPVRTLDRAARATQEFNEERRAEAVRAIIEQSEAQGLSAAGSVAVHDAGVAIANSCGVGVAADTTELYATVLAADVDGASGWASTLLSDASFFVPAALGVRAAEIAARSRGRRTLDPGTYAVVLAPEAVSELLSFLGYLGFGAKAYAEHSSFLNGAVGTCMVDARISLYDDALSPEMVGLPFDYEGQPKRRVPLLEGGVAGHPVTDSYYAQLLSLPNTGHALPAPNPQGPLPINLVMAAGNASVEDMIGSVERGVYVSRFHYVNVEDPLHAVLTGMTRDGTFRIEGGRITVPLHNMRFTQDVLEAFRHVGAVSLQRQLTGSPENGAVLAPAVLLERWAFTGQSKA